MKFRSTTIAPAGRNKYGNYTSKGNITRSVVSTTYGGNASTTSIAEPEVAITPTNTPQYYANIEKGEVIFTSSDISHAASKGIGFTAMRGNDNIPVFIMDMTQITPIGNTFIEPQYNGITGIPNIGMSAHTMNNGTSGATLFLDVNPNLGGTGGTLNIPVCIYQGNGSQPYGDDTSAWYNAYRVYDNQTGTWSYTNEIQQVWFTLSWIVDVGGEASSVYRLSLSNDNASVICNSGGTPLTASTITLPVSSGKTYYGSDLLTGATYDIDWGGVQGGVSAITDGVLTISFNRSSFNFTGSSASIMVSAKTDSTTVVDVKTFNLCKAIAGGNGQDATIWWLETNYDEIIYDPNTRTISPDLLCVSGYSQTGIQTPVYHQIDDAGYYFAKYEVQPIGSSSWIDKGMFPNGGLRLNASSGETYQRIRITFWEDYPRQLDQEDIEILRHGTSGATGDVGRTGASIRGPYNYAEISGDTRYWFNGEPFGATESEKWIDVIIKDGVYYYCNTTYYGLIDWANNSDKWTSGETFDFIATNLLLADDAKINIMTSNEIYLGSGNTITGGMAGGTGSTPAFWAGNSEAEPNFSVDHNGNLVAKSGKFYGNVYIPFKNATSLSAITRSGRTMYEADYQYGQIISDVQVFSASTSSCPIIILPIPTAEYYGYTFTFTSGRAFGSTNEEVWAYEVVPYGYKLSGTLPSNQKYIYDFTFTDTSNSYYKGVAVPGSVGIGGGALIKICCMPYYYNGQERAVWGIIEKFGTITNDNY